MYPIAQRSDGTTIRALRRALAEREPLHVPGVFNGMTARIATEAGFRALYISGLGVAGADYGLPDRAMLGLSDHTVKFHLRAVFTKLGAHSRTEAVSVAVRRGLLML